jgi:hypothetical protein
MIKIIKSSLFPNGVQIQVLFNITNIPLDDPGKHTGFILLSSEIMDFKIEFQSNQVWFLKASLMKFQNQLKLRLDSRVYTFTSLVDNNSGLIYLSEIYKISANSPMISNFLATWKLHLGLLIINDQFIWERRKNLTGLVLETATESVRYMGPCHESGIPWQYTFMVG